MYMTRPIPLGFNDKRYNLVLDLITTFRRRGARKKLGTYSVVERRW